MSFHAIVAQLNAAQTEWAEMHARNEQLQLENRALSSRIGELEEAVAALKNENAAYQKAARAFIGILGKNDTSSSVAEESSDSISKLKEKIRKKPNNPELYFRLGCTEFLENQHQDAQKTFFTARRLGLKNWEIDYYEAQIHMRNDGELAQAESCIVEAAKKSPNQGVVHYVHAQILQKLGKLGEAQAAKQRAKELGITKD